MKAEIIEKDMWEPIQKQENNNFRIGRFIKIILTVVCLLLFQQTASYVGNLIANLFSYAQIDPDNSFMSITVHHIVQGFIALIAILIIWRVKKIDFGFKRGNIKVGLKYFAFFSLGVLAFAIILYSVGISLGLTQLAQYPLNTRNILGTLGFQLLLSGTSEELLFRALPIVLLSQFTKSGLKIGKLNISLAIILAAILFMIAHIRWSISPFTISADPMQLVQSLIFALFYGKAFEKSGSILYPMLMHSVSNVIMVGLGYIIILII